MATHNVVLTAEQEEIVNLFLKLHPEHVNIQGVLKFGFEEWLKTKGHAITGDLKRELNKRTLAVNDRLALKAALDELDKARIPASPEGGDR